MLIRRMRAEDLEAVRNLERLCFSDPWSMKILTEALGNAYDYFFVAEEEGKVFGYGNLRILAGEGEIERIAVHPKKRGRGTGRKLMEAMEEFAVSEGVQAVTLEVRAGNGAARNLYSSMGFFEEAVRKGYYRDPAEDAIIMWKRRT